DAFHVFDKTPDLFERFHEVIVRRAGISPTCERCHLGNQCIDRCLASKIRIATPRSRKIAALDQLSGSAPKRSPGAGVVRTARKGAGQVSPVFAAWASSQDAANCLARVCKLIFKPVIEREIE